MTESDMVFDCYSKLKCSNICKEIILEVPYMSRCIDMIIVDNDYKLVSVEFKIKNWRKALEQARDHMLGADKSYVCIPKPPKEVSPSLISELEKHGIGLFLYDTTKDFPLEEFIPPKSCEIRWEPWATSLKSLVNRISEEQIFQLTEA
jgi:hypothetical protein